MICSVEQRSFFMSRIREPNSTQQATAQLRESAAQVQQNLRDMGGQVKDAAEEKFNELRDQAAEYYQEGRQRARAWEQSLEHYVQERPLKSLLIAAGVGAVLGFLWRRS
jgi:ElaB/YqjD/DUF883 family membrane-anchored ribosome-binding protein